MICELCKKEIKKGTSAIITETGAVHGECNEKYKMEEYRRNLKAEIMAKFPKLPLDVNKRIVNGNYFDDFSPPNPKMIEECEGIIFVEWGPSFECCSCVCVCLNDKADFPIVEDVHDYIKNPSKYSEMSARYDIPWVYGSERPTRVYLIVPEAAYCYQEVVERNIIYRDNEKQLKEMEETK